MRQRIIVSTEENEVENLTDESLCKLILKVKENVTPMLQSVGIKIQDKSFEFFKSKATSSKPEKKRAGKKFDDAKTDGETIEPISQEDELAILGKYFPGHLESYLSRMNLGEQSKNFIHLQNCITFSITRPPNFHFLFHVGFPRKYKNLLKHMEYFLAEFHLTFSIKFQLF